MKAEQYALLYDTTLIGVYHSHPQHPAIPSEHDLKQALPFFSYIIVSVLDGKSDNLFSWRLNEAWR
jgi:proteasome lid subunit RPN8/RPN11